MAKVYTCHFAVRTCELGPDEHVRLPIYQNYLEEAAVQASASNGYSWHWYRQNRRVWVARKISIRYWQPAGYGDSLEMRTWVSDFRAVQSHREFDMRRAVDGVSVLRGRTNWVFVDLDTGQPRRVGPEFGEAFAPDGILENLDVGVPEGARAEGALYEMIRHVRDTEIDSAMHVNNAMYTAWAEDAIALALRQAGWGADVFAASGILLQPLSREIEYFRPAVVNDEVNVSTRLALIGGNRLQWQTEIRRGADLLTRDLATRAVVDAISRQNRLIPEALRNALIG
jgi:acyl-CoA thioester hydrolase